MAWPGEQRIWRNRADAAFDAVLADRLYPPHGKVFARRRWWLGRRYESLWPMAGAWSAACTLASLDDHAGVADFLPLLFDGLAAYHPDGAAALTGRGPIGFQSAVVPPLGPGGEVYYDDNGWLGLALLRHHELTGDGQALSLARRLCDFVASGWSTEPSWSHPGGVRWKEPGAAISRNACSNGPAAELAVRLHRITGAPGDLALAARTYDWVRSALLGGDHLYADRIAPDGTVAPHRWSYNQGTMIGAGVLLAEATGDPAYLAQAGATAAACLGRFDLDALVDREGPPFTAVLFRNLFLLDRVAPDPAYQALAAEYGEVMWEDYRDRRTGLFGPGDSLLNASAAMVQLYALLAGAPPHP
ncbi:MAG TPA: glycoside hydrolase family 76 protein [Acidimicrobiales bacterium]|jgi:hypothetical protein|nr:glycoside hydrolase family 76 protein [Acidimicrobiales bacterium]